MDGAILNKINAFPVGKGLPGHLQSPDFTKGNVISADAGVFHKTNHVESPEAVPETPELDYADGLRDGKAKSDIVYQNTINVMQNTLNKLQQEIKNIAKQIEVDHLFTVNKCLTSAVPGLVKLGAGIEIENLIAESAQTDLSGNLHFSVHPDEVEDCRRLCELQRSGMVVSADANLKPSQVKVSWQNGGAEIDCDKVFQSFLLKFEGVLKTLNSEYHTERYDG